MHIREIIGNKLSQILHPELDSDIMSLGLIKSINVNEKTLEVMFRRNLNSINCFEKLHSEVKEKLTEYNRIFNIQIVLNKREYKT